MGNHKELCSAMKWGQTLTYLILITKGIIQGVGLDAGIPLS